MGNKTLKVEIYNRGKEVYGLTYPNSNFNQSKFLKDHEDNYYDLSEDSMDGEVPIVNSHIVIYLDGNEICHEGFKDGVYNNSVKVVSTNKSESYRDLFNADKNDSLVIWFHDYANTKSYSWDEIKDFDPKKLVVYSMDRIDETEKKSRYSILSHVVYDDKDPDEEDAYGSPKTGYDGPYII